MVKKFSTILHLFIFILLMACNSQGGNQAAAQTIKSISADQFEKKMKESERYQLVDVRTPEEYTEGHLKGAINMNVEGETFAADIKTLDKDVPVFVYCRSGRRSLNAAEQLKAKGFKTIYDLDGGIKSWTSKGKPVE